METDKRIQDEIEKASIDPMTGIRHGVIGQHYILEEAFDEFCFDYGKPHCPKCGDEVPSDDLGPFDFYCLKCNYGTRDEEAYPDQPLGFCYDKDGYALADYLGDDILVFRSNFYTYAQLFSSRVQGYGNLGSSVKGGVKTYCLGHDWFEGGIAPYPVYRVSDNVQIVAAKVEIVSDQCKGTGKDTLQRITEVVEVSIDTIYGLPDPVKIDEL